MTKSFSNPVLEVLRVRSCFQHPFVIIRFQESGMAQLKILYQVFTVSTGIGEDADINIIVAYDETMRINGIVKLRNCGDDQVSNNNRFVSLKCSCTNLP